MPFESVRINPLKITSGAFMLSAPFGAWMTLSVFGFVSGSNLWEITNSQTSFPISQGLASSASYSGILLVLGGLVSLRWTKLGLPIAAVAMSLFGIESYSAFGSFPSAFPVSILPGLGVFLALCGIVLGLGALRKGEMTVTSLLARVRAPEGLVEVGIFLTTIFLAADAWNHWADGQLSGFLGVTFVEGVLHRIFAVGVIALLVMFLVQKSLILGRDGGVLVLATFSALILDAAYHFVVGSVVSFVGHDATEIMLHVFTYYGVAFLIIARVLLKR